MTKILIAVVALSALTPAAPALQTDTVSPQGFCNVLPWMPFCGVWTR